ncbi:MAG: hypothetical protein AAB305_00925 [Candidatus Zixiibacteriota bacterium]
MTIERQNPLTQSKTTSDITNHARLSLQGSGFSMPVIWWLLFLMVGLFSDSLLYAEEDHAFPNNWKFTSEYVIDSSIVADSLRAKSLLNQAEASKIAQKFIKKFKDKLSDKKKLTFFVNVPVQGELTVRLTVSEYSKWNVGASPSDGRAEAVADAAAEHKDYPLVPEQEKFSKHKLKSTKIEYKASSVYVLLRDLNGIVIDSLGNNVGDINNFAVQVVNSTLLARHNSNH